MRTTIHTSLFFLLVGASACKTELATSNAQFDKDEDGFINIENGGDDCNDSNPDIHPDAEEACDNLDNDCDGLIDCEDDLTDADGDGVCECDDCDDSDPLAFEGNPEVCDGVDNDCDGDTDESDASDASEWYADTDELPITTWVTATAISPGTTNWAAPVDSATNITAASGVRYPAARKAATPM